MSVSVRASTGARSRRHRASGLRQGGQGGGHLAFGAHLGGAFRLLVRWVRRRSARSAHRTVPIGDVLPALPIRELVVRTVRAGEGCATLDRGSAPRSCWRRSPSRTRRWRGSRPGSAGKAERRRWGCRPRPLRHRAPPGTPADHPRRSRLPRP